MSTKELVTNTRAVSVNDRWLFWAIYPLMALLAVHIGNENSFAQLLRIPSYYSDLLLALICTYGVGLYYRALFKRIDQRFSWDEALRSRLGWHLVHGLALPTLVIVGVEILYLVLLLEIPLQDSSVFYLEMPIIATFCVLINLLYFGLYFRKHNAQLAMELRREKEKVAPVTLAYKEHFTVDQGPRSIHLSAADVAYFVMKQKAMLMVTKEGSEHLYDGSLEKVNEEVSPHDFFRLNRQVIAHRKAIASYERTDTRKLLVHLNPEANDAVFVSKSRATEFLKWMKQQ